jgi:hypothetical protein
MLGERFLGVLGRPKGYTISLRGGTTLTTKAETGWTTKREIYGRQTLGGTNRGFSINEREHIPGFGE